MGTPFSKYANLKLFLEKPSGRFEIDPETGNEQELFTTQVIKASVEPNSKSSREYPGINSQALYLEGNLTVPKFSPAFIKANTRCKASLLDLATNSEIKGEFLFDLVAQSRFKAVTKVLGTEIRGWFTTYG